MKAFTSIFFLCWTLLLQGQELNNYGHILTHKTGTTQADIHHHNGMDYVHYETLQLRGNGFYRMTDYLVTLENSCGGTPSTLRIFDLKGQALYTAQYPQIINLQWNSGEGVLYFLSLGKWVVMNLATFEAQTVESSYPIAVDEAGKVAYFDAATAQLRYGKEVFPLEFLPMDVEIGGENALFVFGRNQYQMLDVSGKWQKGVYSNGHFFQSKQIGGVVHWVEKSRGADDFRFQLFRWGNEAQVSLEESFFPYQAQRKKVAAPVPKQGTKEAIACPLNPDLADFPFRIGNSYAEHQNYGGFPYLHPGVDILGDIGQPVYSSSSGVVKAVLTTGGDIYWRVAIADEDTDARQEGYLYAHLEESTIPVTVGDRVEVGDYLGDLVEWTSNDFHHLHFARLQHSGAIWNGDWTTIDNVLADITNFSDESVPVFEDLWNGQTIAFRSASDAFEVLEANNLQGQFDVVCHVHDRSNSDWRVDVHGLRYELWNLEEDVLVHSQMAFDYNFALDTYYSNAETLEILETIYSNDGPWATEGNYDVRDFYQQVSRSDGIPTWAMVDQTTYFDSRNYPDGKYLFRIYAVDAVGNEAQTEVEVEFRNEEITDIEKWEEVGFQVFPNPSNGRFRVRTNGKSGGIVELFDVQGKKVATALISSNGGEVELEGVLSGVYLLKAKMGDLGRAMSRWIVVE